MTHTPELLRIIEQNELDKTLRCVRLVDSDGVFALAVDEKYGGLVAAAPDMLEALESVLSLIDESSGVAGYHLNGEVATWEELAIREELESADQESEGRGMTEYHIIAGVICYIATVAGVCFCFWVENRL